MVKVVVDSDAIFALYNPNDPLNAKAKKTFEQLISKDCQFIYPTSVVFEIITLFQRVLPQAKVTSRLVDLIKEDELNIFVIEIEILKEAARLFKPSGSKKNTLIDCSVAASARKIKADGVFSYDNFYTKQGLKLAEELV